MIKSNSGQSLVEALFVVVFTTVIMFAFIQICVTAVDDMAANEAAFVGMRSAAVTKRNFRLEEARQRVKNYMFIYYPFSNVVSELNSSKFVFTSKSAASKNIKSSAGEAEETEEEETAVAGENGTESGNDYISVWEGSKETRDYSGRKLAKQTVKLYYYTRIMFGYLTAKNSSKKDKVYAGSRRYQSARYRMIPSPDENFYYKAFPGAKKFNEKENG